jgi:hypothetical protein
MALLTPTTITTAGTAPTLAAVSASDTVAADDSMWLHVNNGGGGSINVTISDGGLTPAGNAASTSAVAVAAGTAKLFPLTARTNAPATGVTTITYSGTSSVTAAVFRK